MQFYFVIFGVLLLGCASAQSTKLAERIYPNCVAAADGTPCVELVSTIDEPIQSQGMSCAVSDDKAQLLVVDTEGFELVYASNLSSISGTYQRTYCEYYEALPEQVAGQYLMYQSALGDKDNSAIGSGYCETLGDCRQRILQFKSLDAGGFGVLNSTLAIANNNYQKSIYTVKDDIIDAPIVPWICRGPRPYPFEGNTDPMAVIMEVSTTVYLCPNDFYQAIFSEHYDLGFRFILRGVSTVGTYPPARTADAAGGMTTFFLSGDTWPTVVAEIAAGRSVSVSFGPSFVKETPILANLPLGLATVDPVDGALTPNTTFFKSALQVIQESVVGGRDNIVWIVGPDSDFGKALELDVSDPTSPVLLREFSTEFQFHRLDYSVCPRINNTFQNWYSNSSGAYNALGNLEYFAGCPALNADNYSFAYSLFQASQTVVRGVTFFPSGADLYALLSYHENAACVACIDTRTTRLFLTLWRVSDPSPTLVDRLLLDEQSGRNFNIPSEDMVYALGLVFYTDATQPAALNFWRSVSASGIDASFSFFNDTRIPGDAKVTRRQLLPQNRLLVNYLQYGTTIYNIDATGIVSIEAEIPAFADPSVEVVNSGVQQLMCGSGNPVFYRFNNQGSTGSPGIYESSTLEAWSLDTFVPGTTTSTSSSTTTTTTTTTGSMTSTTTTTTTGTTTGTTSGNLSPSAPPLASPSVVPSASAIPPPPPPPCPDTCMYDCTYIEPSKLPKPSVKPSKQPAATKVPEPSFFIIELTYESAAADCGPDCCEVREWLGDDTVAASFYMCSEDSQTKNRAPEYDDKAGTCSIFLAAQEGSDPGQISQAEFDAAVATLEGNFATLCTDAKNCDASTQSGKSASYIIGGGAGSVVASVLLVIAAVAALL